MNRIIASFVLMTTMACASDELKDNLVIAHRGVPYFAPEETAPAFLLARDLGADYLEADLQRTKDGVIIALHDNTLARTTNIGAVFPDRAQDPVNTFSWDELQQLDAGSWFNKRYPNLARPSYNGLKILSLEQLLAIASDGENKPGLYLETKIPQQFPGLEADLKQLLLAKNWYEKKLTNGQPAVILQSFVPKSIELLRQEFPLTPINYLLWKGEGCLTEFNKEHLAECLGFAAKMNINLLGTSFSGENTGYFNQLEPWFIEDVRSRGMKIHAYTFDTSKDIEQFGSLVDGQFTNRTDLSLDFYGRDRASVEEILLKHGF
jgi:glycerophosphoryl diester phosphodiesterase